MPDENVFKPRSPTRPALPEDVLEPAQRARDATRPYAELEVTSNFTFLTGASHPDELVRQAALLGHRAIAATDTNTLAGIVRFHASAKEAGLRFVPGCRLVCTDAPGLGVLVYPMNKDGYGGLCALLTRGKRRAPKGECHLAFEEVLQANAGLIAVASLCSEAEHGPGHERVLGYVRKLKDAFDDDRLSVALSRSLSGLDAERVRAIEAVASGANVPLVVTNDVHAHSPERRPLQDVLTCIRHGCTIEQAGRRLFANAERHLKSEQEMRRLFPEHERAIARTMEIVDRTSGFSLDQLRYEYPEEVVPAGVTAQQHLENLAWAGARTRYPAGVPEKVRAQIVHELKLIGELSYAPYFLTVESMVRFAVGRGILCQGRGAAANSAVCYCLGITAVDPDRVSTLFERFVSKERQEPPDIDIDFEHERREEVIQYLYRTYGRERAALTAEVICFRGRLAVREVGKVMGLSRDVLDRLSKEMSWWERTPPKLERLKELGFNPKDPHLALTLRLAGELVGFPRHLSQHVGGFVITRTPLERLVPIENAGMPDRTIIEWDKDDIETLGMLKIDVLGLGMLTCIRKALDLSAQNDGQHDGQSDGQKLTLATIPAEDPAVYDMICKADTVGVFQIESRAQMSMLPRLKPRCYYDLVIEVAIVRPGPIQGNMVHPYLRRRNGEEPVHYFDATIERVLGRTLGVPLFQEQAMSLAVEAAGFTPGEADQLRRAIAAWKARGNKLALFGERIIDGMLARGYPREFAERCFEQVKGFSGYGFPESHAASFALLVYASSWLKKHRPAAFAAALINSQPMGFYQPAQIIRDAREHGVEVRPIDVNHSAWDCTLEARHGSAGGPAVRLGMRLVRGLAQEQAERIMRAVREKGAFRTVPALWRSSGVKTHTLRHLAGADAFGSMGLSRRAALWAVQPLKDESLPLFDGLDEPATEPVYLPRASEIEQVQGDYSAAGLSLRPHPLSFVREELEARGITPSGVLKDAAKLPDKASVTVAGLVLVRQRPGTASGVVFMTLEDETGIANLVVWPRVFERFRAVARHCQAVVCTGQVQRSGEVVHVVAKRLKRLEVAAVAGVKSRDFH